MIIQHEKERLIKEHAANLDGYLPKAIIDNNFKNVPAAKAGYKHNHS